MELADWILNIVLPTSGGIAGWIVGRKQRAVATRKGELENVESGLGIYKEMISDLREQIDELRKRQDSLHKENIELRKKLAAATHANNQLKERIAALEAQSKGDKP